MYGTSLKIELVFVSDLVEAPEYIFFSSIPKRVLYVLY